VRDGEEWVVDGQKVWTSSAHVADLALAVCRTDPDAPKHRGLTTFLVDMHAPGVEVRPLRQMTGTAGFNEVFLTDVRVPDSHRVGDLNAGFGVILTTLGNERTIATRAPSSGGGIGQFERLLGVVDTFGDRRDPRQRQQLAQLYVGGRIKELLIERWRASLRPGVTPGPEMSVLKLHSCRHNAELVRMLTEVLGSRLSADTEEWGTFAWNEFVLSTPGARIGGGTEEILRNTVGEKVLGLPKEPKP
jgi:acyl-CoA dehydrogenase